MKRPANKTLPPKLATRFLNWFLKADLAEEVTGDLEEQFFYQLKSTSPFRAKMNYWFQVMNYLRPFAIRHFLFSQLNPLFMFKHHIKISFRTLIRDRGYTFLNIGGLTLGMAVALLIGLWINDELNRNKYHENYDRIAQVMQNQTFNGEVETWWSQARQIGPALREDYGDLFEQVVVTTWRRDLIMRVGEKRINRPGHYMEAGGPHLLTLDMVYGNRDGLQDPSSILISESVSEALFGTENPIGKTIKANERHDFQVSGVFRDIPFNSAFHKVKWLAPWEFFMEAANLEERTGWGNSWFQCIAQISKNTDMASVSAAIKNVKLDHVKAAGDDDDRFHPEVFLHPMSRWNLYGKFENGKNAGGDIQYVWMFGLVGIFVLLLACINFVNLSTARSERRAKEVGVRKAIGSDRTSLIGQFFSESYLVAFFAFAVAIATASLALPGFNHIAKKEISMPLAEPWFWLGGLLFCGITGFLSGLYPSLYLSSFSPVKVLKGTFKVGAAATLPRKALVVVQFTVSVTLIIGTLMIFQQIQHVKNRPIGYDNTLLLNAYINSDEVNEHYDVFRNELLNTGAVQEVTMTDSPITSTDVTNSGFDWEGKDPEMSEEFSTLRVSHEFGDVINWEIIEGRDFSRERAGDTLAFIINESAVDYIGMEDPVGKTMNWGENRIYTIIGIVKDLVTQSPYQPVKQTLFLVNYSRTSCVTMKIKPTAVMSEALSKIEPVFKKYDRFGLFDYSFVDEDYSEKFHREERVGKLAGLFTLLAIIISCLGVFGLAAYVAERRNKEISIRKVLGATVPELWHMLSKEFIVLVSLGCLFAIPIAYYFLNGWLQDYAYRTELNWWVFAIAASGAILITLFTVSFQAVKAAMANPVDALKAD